MLLLDEVIDLDLAREFFKARGYYVGNRNLFSDRDLYIGMLVEGEDFDVVEESFYLYMEDGDWVTRINPGDGGDPVIERHSTFRDVWNYRFPFGTGD